MPFRRSTSSTFRCTVQCGSNPPSCGTYPIPRRSWTASTARTSSSPRQTTPASGSTRRLKQRRSVVLPEPLSPTRATHALAGTVSVTPSSAMTVPNCFETPDAESATALALGIRGRSTDWHRAGSMCRAFCRSVHYRSRNAPPHGKCSSNGNRTGNGTEQKTKNVKATESPERKKSTTTRRDREDLLATNSGCSTSPSHWCVTAPHALSVATRFSRSVHSRCPTGFLLPGQFLSDEHILPWDKKKAPIKAP